MLEKQKKLKLGFWLAFHDHSFPLPDTRARGTNERTVDERETDERGVDESSKKAGGSDV